MPNRRTVLRGVAFGGAAVLAGGAAPPASALDLYVRLKAHAGGEPVPMAYRADIFLMSPDAVMPLLVRAEGLSWTRARALAPGRWEFSQIDAGRYLDPQTGAPLERFAPPGAVAAVPVRTYRTPGRFVATPGALEAPALAGRPDVTLSMARDGPDRMGGTLVVTEDLQTTFGGGAEGRVDAPGRVRRRVSQFSTFTGPAAEAGSPSIRSVASAVIITDTRPWLPTLERPLRVMWRMTGVKLDRVADAPASIRDWLAATHPDLMQAPRL